MKNELTIEQVTKELIDGLDMDYEYVKSGLIGLMDRECLTLDELRDMCWKYSVDVFDKIM